MTVVEGAYYAKHLTEAKAQGRISNVARDPLMTIRAIWDIGGTGAKADCTALSGSPSSWAGKSGVLDYYEARGQELSAHVAWLREKGYEECPVHPAS